MLTRSSRKRSAMSKAKFQRRFPLIKGNLLLRIGFLLALTGALSVLYSTKQSTKYDVFREGTIAPEEVIAPEDFRIFKTEAAYQAEVAAVRNQIPPVIAFNETLPGAQQHTLTGLLEDIAALRISALPDSEKVRQLKRSHPAIGPVSESTLRFLLRKSSMVASRLAELGDTTREILAEIYRSGVIENKADVVGRNRQEVVLLRDTDERIVPIYDIRDLTESVLTLQENIEQKLPPGSASAAVKAVYELVDAYLTPNLVYDPLETERRRLAAADNVSHTKGTVFKDERIIDKHDRVTKEHIDKLQSLVIHMNARRQKDPYLPVVQLGARVVISGLMVTILFGYLSVFKSVVYRQTSHFLLFGIILLMPALVAHYAATLQAITPFLVPIALSAMLATVLFDAEIGFVVSVISSAICASILGSLQYSLVFLITGVTGAYSVRKVLHRSDFYRSIVYLIAAYSLTIGATSVLLFTYSDILEFVQKIKWDLAFGIFTACASSVLTIGLLPIFESVFNVVTPITLLELSDLNRPLLRNLAIRAPGTYSHSIIMASLSEAAADAIGANRLLARVGCYYHDIGKMIRPHYFIENQKGVNPHDELQPKMSALILLSHVKEGIELAAEEGLPRAIVDLIPQHHGTSEIASFKHRALEKGDKQSVRDEDFQYSGPRPQTKEAGIINLADAVEAATRTLPNTSPDRIKGMVQTIIKGRFTAGELDECDLTLRDLTRIQKAFLPILQATRHSRVLYPWQQQARMSH